MIALAIVVTVITACGGGTEQASEITSATRVSQRGSTAQVEIAPLALSGKFEPGERFQALLSKIPSTADNRRSIALNDFIPIWEAWKSLGAARPDNEEGSGAMDRFFNDLAVNRTGNALFVRPRVDAPRISGFDTIGGLVNTYDFLGFDQRSVDGTALTGPNALPMELVVGDYNVERSLLALENCGECREYELVEYAGQQYYAWGAELAGDLSDRFAPPLYDHAGRGGRFAISDGAAMRSLTSEQIESMLDAAIGNVPNMFENSDYQLAAASHNAVGTYSAWFSNLPFQINDAAQVAINANNGLRLNDALFALTASEPLVPYDMISVGWGVDTGMAYGVLVLIQSDDAAAERNSELLTTRFQETPRVAGDESWASVIDKVEIGTVGKALIAKLFPHPGQALYTIDPFEFAYGLAVYE